VQRERVIKGKKGLSGRDGIREEGRNWRPCPLSAAFKLPRAEGEFKGLSTFEHREMRPTLWEIPGKP